VQMKGVLVSEVVNFILVLGDQYDDGDPISPLKLQKLLYYCQGFNLGAYNHPLFKEDIEAWEHGPVVVSVWRSYRIYGSRAIDVPEPLLIRRSQMNRCAWPRRYTMLTVNTPHGSFGILPTRNLLGKTPQEITRSHTS
jgi:uncharacterized phage-associated protein